ESDRLAGTIDQATACYARAHALAPNIAFILWQLARAQLTLGNRGHAFEYTSSLLGKTRLFDQSVFDTFAPPRTSVETFISQILPPNAAAARSYLRFLIQRRNVSGAVAVWNQMLQRGYADPTIANEQVAFLLREKRPG